MNIQQAIEQYRGGNIDRLDIRRNLTNRRQWFVMIKQMDGKLLMLVDEDDEPVVNENLEQLFELLKGIGFREANIVL